MSAVSVGRRTFLSMGSVMAAAALLGVACSSFSSDDPPVVPADGADTEVPQAVPDTGAPDASTGADAADAAPGRDAQFSLVCPTEGTRCTTLGSGCCFDNAKPPSEQFSCRNEGDACDVVDARRYLCDDADDCTALGKAGNVCCGTINAQNPAVLQTAICTLPESCEVAHQEVRRCDPSVPGQCPPGKNCVNVTSWPSPSDAGFIPLTVSFYGCQR